MEVADKEKILRKFLLHGYQLDESALDHLSKASDAAYEADRILRHHPKTTTLTQTHIKSLISTQPQLTIIKSPKPPQKPITPDTIIKTLEFRYLFLKNFILGHPNLPNITSINKIADTGSFSMIGVVREVDSANKIVVVEDKTGVLKVRFDDKIQIGQMMLDEVVGMACVQEGGATKLVDLAYPDIPLKHVIAKSIERIKCMFLPNNPDVIGHKKTIEWCEENIAQSSVYIFILNQLPKRVETSDIFKAFPKNTTPVFIGEYPEITDAIHLEDNSLIDIGGVKLFLSTGKFLKGKIESEHNTLELLVKLLKKRHLNPQLDLNFMHDNDPFLLDTIPDILAVGTHHLSDAGNYKGTTIITSGSLQTQRYIGVDLQTRETIKIETHNH